MADFGFVGAAYQAPSIYQNASECINFYTEVDATKQEPERGTIALYPTPGLLRKLQLDAAEVRGMYVLPGGQSMLAICGASVYIIGANFTSTLIGSLNTSAGQIGMADNGISIYIGDGPNRYSYNIASQLLATIAPSDGGFSGSSAVSYVDDFFVYNNPATNQWGATSPLSTVSPNLSFSSKDSGSGNLVTLIADHREVFLLGERDTERWVNVGSFPFPFQRIPGASIQHGCAAKYSVKRLGESIAFLSQDDRGQAVVVQMQGYQPKRISTHAVENDINTGVISDAVAYTYQLEGHEFYVLNFPSQDKTWVYDLATSAWHKRASRDDLNNLHRHRGNCSAVFQGLVLVGDYANGKIYSLDAKTYTDDGVAILRMRRCMHLTHELKRIYHHSLQIQFQPGVGLETGQGSDPQVMLRWSDDGASTWSQYYPLKIGKTGAYRNRAVKRVLGAARDRVYEVTITDPVNAVIISAELQTSEGSN